MDPRLKAELTARDKWTRLLYIVAYALMWQVAELVLALTVILQFVWTLFTGSPNPGMRDLGHGLGLWLRQAAAYATWASDARPWPFGNPWPAAQPQASHDTDR